MLYEEKIALSKVRLQKAKDCLIDTADLISMKRLDSAANRSYYAIFHAMRAVLAVDGVERAHHSGVISEFRRNYIKTGIFEEEISDIIGDLLELRTNSDYDDYYLVTKQEILEQYENAKHMVAAVEAYLSGVYAAEQAE